VDFANPPYAFVLVDGVLAPRLLGSIYRGYAATVELQGTEDVLEFGCGSGGISERLAPRLADGSLTCVDISPPMMEIATRRLRRYSNVRCRVGRIEDLAFPDGAFDVVVIHNALHDIPAADRAATVAELVRLLRVDGRLHLREPTKLSHGMPAAAYRELLTGAVLSEVRSHEGRVFAVGPVFDAVYAKRATPSDQS